MSPERFRQVEELYHAARQRTARERAALLAQANPEVRREACRAEKWPLFGPPVRRAFFSYSVIPRTPHHQRLAAARVEKPRCPEVGRAGGGSKRSLRP